MILLFAAPGRRPADVQEVVRYAVARTGQRYDMTNAFGLAR
ncbi:MAG TPA: hypothetical protein VF315_05200 [Steroidobacteraceae bacterium]